MRNTLLLFSLLLALLTACGNSNSSEDRLPILGERRAVSRELNDKAQTDTVYHTIGEFNFIDQDSSRFTQTDVAGKVYVADFIFTTCPSICIPMAKEMLRVHERFGQHPDFAILSHTLDPGYDTPEILRQYARGLGIEEGSNWYFLTSNAQTSNVYDVGQTRYMVTARTDKEAPGGVLHSGAFILVDREGRIRGMYDGTDANEVDSLMADVDRLLAE